MKRAESITRWLHIVIATLAVWSQEYVESAFKRLDASQYTLLGTVVLAALGMVVLDWVALGVIDRVRFVRMLIAGKDDIEGDWVNVVFAAADVPVVINAEYTRIRYHAGQYVVSGDTWNLEGGWIEEYVTGGSTYAGRQLEYFYRSGIHQAGGYGVMTFSPHDTVPTDYVCRYIDEERRELLYCRGRRLTRKLVRVPQDRRRELALEFAKNFQTGNLLDMGAALRPVRQRFDRLEDKKGRN